jgi:membrane protease YdiL (CAAX protease family)
VLAGIAQAATGYRPGSGRPVPLAVNAASLAGLWAGLGGGTIFASRYRGSGSLAGDFGFSLRWPLDVGLGVAAGLTSTYVLVPLLYLPFERLYPSIRHRLNTPANQDTNGVHGALGITVLFLLLAVGAPVVEELFFRGLLQRSLARRFNSSVSIAGSAALFGLAHFELLQLPALVLFGVVLAVLADKTGRLGPGIVAHMTFNAATVLTLTLHL